VLSKDEGDRRVNRIKYRKTFNGNIIKVLDEQYISKIPCGVASCQQCETNVHTTLSWMQDQPQVIPEGGVIDSPEELDTIYLLDDAFVRNQVDLIQHYDKLDNCVVLQSTLENLPQRGYGGKQWISIEELELDSRNFYYFRNENHESTYFSEEETETLLKGKSKEFKSRVKCFRAYLYYISHWKHTLDSKYRIVLLTDLDKQSYDFCN
jgi:hypothetical protein